MIKRTTSTEVTELCSECMSENTFQWDVSQDGYKAYCPHCGSRLMLCGICPIHNTCGYDSETDTCPMQHEGCLDKEDFIEYLKYNFDIDEHAIELVSNMMDFLSGESLHIKTKQKGFKHLIKNVIPLTEKEFSMIKF